jgi:hypothetical protein
MARLNFHRLRDAAFTNERENRDFVKPLQMEKAVVTQIEVVRRKVSRILVTRKKPKGER